MKEAETTPTGEGMTISAVTEGIGADVKADLAYKYDVIWRWGDKICVKNSEKKSVEFTLVNGAGTTKGTFSSTGGNISGEVEGFSPASVANLIWPAEQQNNQVPPMYCKKTLSSIQNQTFNFASLGSVLQLNFNSTTAGIVLKSIEVKADEAMSGAFTIENGQAKISQPEGDKPDLPDGALPGVFTVSNDNGTTKTPIHFSQGNLYYDGSKFNFEANQYGFNSSYQSTYVSHFYWSKDASVAYANSYNESGTTGSDVFFTNADETTAKEGFTVNVDGKEQNGCVFLPAAGYRSGSDVSGVGVSVSRRGGVSVRLITESN